MLKIAASFFALTAAAAAAAQPAPQGPPTAEQIAAMPPEGRAMVEASMAFGTCVQGHLSAVPANTDADAAAGAALASCETQRAGLEAAVERLIDSPLVPEAQKAQARAQMRQDMAGLRGVIAGQLRTARAGAAPSN